MPNEDIIKILLDKMFKVSPWGAFALVALIILAAVILWFIIKNKNTSVNKQKNVIKGDINGSEINNVKIVK
ncbi:MAG: hypothetical protein A3J93_00015 [Candidatus Magasanikbacteria bacterium RIFOXYC2_FULL_42_28]|uniref:Uncharacterized protein n=1 Tax=Candidatus Magasanikbacteria bacterium RIFOXYC2_FULL_42_28 TaxID=1798704 RepID=A0A1F6NW16_9BACT|nr:MAG: hypothetical protein A3J93_00015 [Candidatus Magasanikbacteria bacterium RIFOXYC2_FULL_42_28]